MTTNPTCTWGDCQNDAVEGYPNPFGTYAFCADHLEIALNEFTETNNG